MDSMTDLSHPRPVVVSSQFIDVPIAQGGISVVAAGNARIDAGARRDP